MSTADDILSEFGDHQCAICGTDCVAVAAALDAIPPREPTEAMTAAGCETLLTVSDRAYAIFTRDISSVWRAMYDAARAEKDAPNESRCTHKSSKIMRGIDNTYDVAWCDDCGEITWASDGYLTDEQLHRSDREKWCQRRVLAWGCASEANGGKVCGWWCGHPETCAVALRADGETAEKEGK